MFSPFLLHTDLQRELISNSLQGAGTVTSVQFSEPNQRSRIHQKIAACVINEHMSPHDDWNIQHRTIPTPSSNLHFIPVRQAALFQPQISPASSVLQLVPVKAPEKGGTMPFNSSSFYVSHKPVVPEPDVFLQAPFSKRQETTKAVPGYSHILTSGPQPVQPSKLGHLVPVSSLPAPQPLNIRGHPLHMEAPLLQQPVAVHRVVSRIGQQAAVGSVAVGPLHSWTVGGRALDDPFTHVPSQPRCFQGK